MPAAGPSAPVGGAESSRARAAAQSGCQSCWPRGDDQEHAVVIAGPELRPAARGRAPDFGPVAAALASARAAAKARPDDRPRRRGSGRRRPSRLPVLAGSASSSTQWKLLPPKPKALTAARRGCRRSWQPGPGLGVQVERRVAAGQPLDRAARPWRSGAAPCDEAPAPP